MLIRSVQYIDYYTMQIKTKIMHALFGEIYNTIK